ncbi:MAG: DEAD/DEAH box helicase family protein [Candidatus Competibacteraceae bacterium]
MSDKHQEKHFETELVDCLTAGGWLEGEPAKYDRALALYPEDLIGFLQDTQPREWEKLSHNYGADAETRLCERAVKLLDDLGALTLLRHGFKDKNARFQLCQFKPSHGFNPQIAARYEQVRCRVVRQVHYSLANENSIDLVLFVNGIPTATLELKTDFTQSIADAIAQYRYDRPPKDPKTKRAEPLLTFKRGALVHFAVSTDEVYMTTRLAGKDTVFLPFNQGNDGGAGNPPNPNGYRTAYLWERVLTRDNWLDLLGRFIHLEQKQSTDPSGRKKTTETLIFPRFHQWEAVNNIVTAAAEEGPGHKYLIQHSAGSGKSNSIGWLAHRLASLHDAQDRKVFDSIIVITDRTVLDAQLQETIYQFEHKAGVVCRITKEGVKSAQLTQALVEARPIIIVTIQTFPFVLNSIRELTTLKHRPFAVIIDEAHSSQTGAASANLKRVLTAEQIEEGVEVSAEELLLAEMQARKQPPNVSFFAFTATPKAKTIELFGRTGAAGLPEPFHVYSMQQAIEEGFILDVLRNYTPYQLAYQLALGGREYDDRTIEKAKGLKELARWVRLHPHNISRKVQIIIEHFRRKIAYRLNGHAKAMVVTGSRKEAVRYKLAFDRYIRDQNYSNLAALVAFSGEVNDPDSGPEPLSETNMNPGLKGRDLRTAFNTDDYQVLLVANKFQTGFDQPLLAAMYVDKKLAGVAAVQTLSRLNRIWPGKTETFILDFVNDPQEILDAFLPYYKTAQLTAVTDPNLIHALQTKLDDRRLYTTAEIDAFAAVFFDPNSRQQDLQAHIAPAVDRFRDHRRRAQDNGDEKALDELNLFRKDIAAFIRLYDFLAQIVDYDDTDLEKRSIFFTHLLPWLRQENAEPAIDLNAVELTHYRLEALAERRLALKDDEEKNKLKPITGLGSGGVQEPNPTTLAALIHELNQLFEGELSDADLLGYANHIKGKLLENETLARQAAMNSKEQFALGDFNTILLDNVIEGLDRYHEMAGQVMGDERIRKAFAGILLDIVYHEFQNQQEGHRCSQVQ